MLKYIVIQDSEVVLGLFGLPANLFDAANGVFEDYI